MRELFTGDWAGTVRRKVSSLDQTWELLSTGYPFIMEQCRSRGTSAFSTRLLLTEVTCMSGREAARLFYDRSKFRRADAAPALLKKTLFGEGGVQGLDGAVHEARKGLFLRCLGKDRVGSFVRVFEQLWESRLDRWSSQGDILWLDEMVDLLYESALSWCGIESKEGKSKAADFRLLIEGPGALNAKHWRARRARQRLDRWLAEVVEQRRASPHPWGESVLDAFASYEEDGEKLPAHSAAVELNNVVRPTIAVAWFLVALELACMRYPELVPEEGDVQGETNFINEVRRLHPFFPMVGARVDRAFEFENVHFPVGRLVLLDLYGTNRDAKAWQDAEAFRPARFEGHEDPFPVHAYLPQGGGDHALGHRCAGEWLTIEIMRCYLRKGRGLHRDLPEQDLRLEGIPARPKSGLVLRNLRVRAGKSQRRDSEIRPAAHVSSEPSVMSR